MRRRFSGRPDCRLTVMPANAFFGSHARLSKSQYFSITPVAFLPSKQRPRSSCSVTLGVKNDCGERYIKSFQCDFPKLFREQHREQREDASQKYMRNALYGRKGGAFQPWG